MVAGVCAIICVVNIHPHHARSRLHWLRKPFLASKLHPWLVNEGSLTARLQARYDDFYVQPVFQKSARPLKEEAMLLKLKLSTTTNVRDVLLMGHQQPVVYAHSILPYGSLRGTWLGLGHLGNKPLGAALFSNKRVERTPLSYLKLSKNHALYRQVDKQLPQTANYLWARRSIFSLNCAKILVTEIFLPKICDE